MKANSVNAVGVHLIAQLQPVLIKLLQGAEISGPILHIDDHPPTGWDDFAAANSPLLFYRSIWGDVLRRGFKAEVFYFWFEEDGDVVYGLAALNFNFGIIRTLYSLVPYGGPIGDDYYRERFFIALEAEAGRSRFHRMQMVVPTDIMATGFSVIEGFIHLLDIGDLNSDSLWTGYRKNLRRDIRLADSRGVTVIDATRPSDVDIFYQLYLKSMERNAALARYPKDLFLAVLDLLVPEFARIMLAKFEGETIAGIVVVRSDDRLHYLMGGSDYDYRQLCPNDLLIHTAIDKAVGDHLRFFDFMGSHVGDTGLIHFKEKWGATSRPVNTYIKDLKTIRAFVWDIAYRAANTRVGSRLAKIVRGGG